MNLFLMRIAVVVLLMNVLVGNNNTLAELDAAWTEISRTLEMGDFDGYRSLYHPDAILVDGIKQESYPIAKALKGWEQGFIDTRSGKMTAHVEARFSQRLFDATTANEKGIFYYYSVENEGLRNDVYVHFETLWVKKDGKWLMMMEYQISEASPNEWESLK
jgi:ketosteroid isomerase-like protein